MNEWINEWMNEWKKHEWMAKKHEGMEKNWMNGKNMNELKIRMKNNHEHIQSWIKTNKQTWMNANKHKLKQKF